MRNLFWSVLAVVCLAPKADTQVTVVPAGTLLQCVMDDPNFSPKTVDVGDPVLCHLTGVMEFGHPAFPRGSYLGGHLEADKQPGHFVGKGYLEIVFDHIGLPNADEQLDAKVVAARGQKVNRQGDIVGHGHAKRDIAEWMIPPLWPWKVIMLPARGPQPKLKGEQVFTLRLMQDVEVPQVAYAAPRPEWNGLGYAKPGPSAQPESYVQPPPGASASGDPSKADPIRQRETPRVYYASPVIPAEMQSARQPASQPLTEASFEYRAPVTGRMQPATNTAQMGVPLKDVQSNVPTSRITLLALQSQTIYPMTDYWVADGRLNFLLPDGKQVSTDIDLVNWQRTSDLNAERGVRLILRATPRSF